MSPTRVVAYEPARRAELFDLMETVWGRPLPADEFEWWFGGNPAGPPLISLAEDEGRVVGVACMSPYRLRVDGEELRTLVPLNVATHPAYRGQGIFTLLEEENESRAAAHAPFLLTFPNEASRRVFVSRLAWLDLPRPRVWARPVLRRRLPPGIERVAEFGPREDALWQRVAPLYGTGLVRDAAYLNWRFARSPRPYVCLGGEDGAAAVGHRRRGRLHVAYLAELVAGPGRPLRQLLRAALAAAQAPVLLALPPHGGAAELVRLGFLPTPKRILVLAKPLRDGTQLPAGWSFSLGDGDSF